MRVYRSPKQFWSFRNRTGREQLLNNLDVEMSTKIQRRVDDPCFNETFTITCEHKVNKKIPWCKEFGWFGYCFTPTNTEAY
jgi:hypothetical protein